MRYFFQYWALTVVLSASVAAQTPAAPLTPEQRAAFESIVKDYILKNPAMLRDALESLKVQEATAAAEKTKLAVLAERATLVSDPESPWIGSANPDVTVVEFFDYRCGFCKQISAALVKIADTDPKVRVVFKNFPILGVDSTYAAKASLVLRKNPHFAAFHAALLASPAYTPEDVKKIAVENGIDPALLAAADSPEVAALLDKNAKLAAELGLSATPALVVGDNASAGAISYEALVAAVAAERNKKAVATK